MPPKLDIDHAAEVLVESIYRSDKSVAKEWGISTKTIQRYRKQMQDDETLSLIVQRKRLLVEAAWVDKIGGAILKAISFIERASEEMDASDPEALHTVTGSFKILAQIDMTRVMINARYGNVLSNGKGDGDDHEVRPTPKVIDAEVTRNS